MKKLLFLVALAFSLEATGLPKEYYKLKGKAQKDFFFNFLYESIKKENLKIVEEKLELKRILSGDILNINPYDLQKLIALKKKYRVKQLYNYNEFAKKIDIVPPSQALAQAAVESGWGKSRFVKEANNIFGHWTYGEKGLIPESRDEGAKHKIRIFDSLQGSIKAYMLNLNRNRAYREFQDKRYEIRKSGKSLSGLELSQTMMNYSGIGEEYLKILKKMIEKYNLTKYDDKFINSF